MRLKVTYSSKLLIGINFIRKKLNHHLNQLLVKKMMHSILITNLHVKHLEVVQNNFK